MPKGFSAKTGKPIAWLDLTGDTYNLLTVIDFHSFNTSNRHAIWNCICICGLKTKVSVDKLRSGHTKSCGHLISPIKTRQPYFPIDAITRNLLYTWKKDVKKRDKHICQKCMSIINIIAHHIESYTNYPELAYKIDNGITLCKKCHTSFHTRYTYTNFTKENFERFMANG